MSGDADDPRARRANQKRTEADLVIRWRAGLYKKPITGEFDVAYLQAIHAHIFQDVPRHQPGVIRDDMGSWIKLRELEGKPGSYEVSYMEGQHATDSYRRHHHRRGYRT